MEENKARKAFIITSLQSYHAVQKIKENDDLLLIVPNENYYQIKAFGESFYPSIVPENNLGERTLSFVISWYKNSSGQDESLTEAGFSVGALLSCDLSVQLPLILRESLALEFWSQRVREFVFPAGYVFRRYVDLLKEAQSLDIDYYDLPSLDTPLTQAYSFRKYDSVKYVHWTKKCLSFFCLPFKKYLVRNRNLYIADWTYKPLLNEDKQGMMLNGSAFKKNVFHSAFFSERKLPKNLQMFSEPLAKNIKHGLEGFGFSSFLTPVIWEVLESSYSEHQGLFESIYCFYEQLLKLRPRSITFPTDFVEEYNIAAQLATLLGVKVFQLIDGFPIIASSPFLTNSAGRYFFSDIYAQSVEFKDQFVRFKGISEESVQVIVPYATRLVSNLKKEEDPPFDALVFTIIPNNLNPEFRLSHLREYLIDVCNELKKKDVTRIVIKCKSRLEEHYVRSVAEELKVEYSFGPSLAMMSKARVIVGGISSAAMEAHLLKIPYYIYEPQENGYTRKLLMESSFNLTDYVARTPEELRQHIANENFFGSQGFRV